MTAIKINCASNYVQLRRTYCVALQEIITLKKRNSFHSFFIANKKEKEKKNNNNAILCNCTSAESRIRMIDVIDPVKNYE